ncbi:MAG: hypothetical protein A3F84_25975 [Candidatus Handelsmanbacteria bacterium RIFCSPLOWO2_12_FULL_64_10]|uniref:PD(D/E)XK endonuclease domain-containing protein n=1 Tax=Handelsmanbacteria sp. (strain RIFCSPLOWO2_12_FULL_64_10) TaxID=1817868 RepID=A0A1F6D120_HANXR|nr:MAG: hypothetical protein A3F84_25975 [Candidatus Handelsmanbacteria bacterium RIFCSPLOWO2_12_FULL_64_10]
MNTDDARFEAARILGNLGVSASELGYRAQALLAETLALMGTGIDAVARVGHPDVTARTAGRVLRIQVKATRQPSFSLHAEDVEGIRPQSPQEDGYLAVLDLRPPLTWICVRHARARVLVGRTVPLAMLKSMEDVQFSAQCTENCAQLLIEHQGSIDAFTFSLLRKRALAEGGIVS